MEGSQMTIACAKCGSTEVIRDGAAFYKDGWFLGRLMAGFEANPGAAVFKGKACHAMRAVLCGQCGYVDLFVTNPQELYAEYKKARNQD